MAVERSGSMLAVDFGNVYTRAVLIDLVDGVYRLVARAQTRTTSGFPAGDVTVGLRRALTELSDVTGRKLLGADGQIITPERADRSGVNSFIATTSMGRALRTVLIGLVPQVSIASALRAAAGTYVEIVETLSLDDARSEQDQLNAILASHPDLIFITGGVEDGAREPVLRLAQTVQLAIKLVQRGRKPAVLYAGNSALVPQIRALFNRLTDLFIAANVRPALDDEQLEDAQLQLALAFDRQQANRGGGFEQVAEMSYLGVLPTAQSYSVVTEYLGKVMPGPVLVVDIGSAVSTLSASINGRVATAIRTDIGLGHSADSLLHSVGSAAVERWLPFPPSTFQIRNYALNKTLRPASLPETLRGLYLEHALLRAGIETLLQAIRPTAVTNHTGAALMPAFYQIIMAGSALTGSGHPAFDALLLLDAVQPTGITDLLADPYGLIAALGAVARDNPEAVVQVLDGGSLERLGLVINVSGKPASGRTALRVRIKTPEGETLKHEVPGGHLWVYPLGIGQKVELDVSVAGRGLSIGGKGRVRLTVEGGAVGIIFDARGRPLPLAANPRGRATQMPLWISEVTGDPVRPIDEAWLTTPKDEGTGVDDASLAARPDSRDKGVEARPKREPRRRGRGKAEAPAKTETQDDEFQDSLDSLRG